MPAHADLVRRWHTWLGSPTPVGGDSSSPWGAGSPKLQSSKRRPEEGRGVREASAFSTAGSVCGRRDLPGRRCHCSPQTLWVRRWPNDEAACGPFCPCWVPPGAGGGMASLPAQRAPELSWFCTAASGLTQWPLPQSAGEASPSGSSQSLLARPEFRVSAGHSGLGFLPSMSQY